MNVEKLGLWTDFNFDIKKPVGVLKPNFPLANISTEIATKLCDYLNVYYIYDYSTSYYVSSRVTKIK